ncbi:T9SS type A sorting domain-containing protein [bacterium]|nr:T9SS type A sorting domain-containing protein [bacterium]
MKYRPVITFLIIIGTIGFTRITAQQLQPVAEIRIDEHGNMEILNTAGQTMGPAAGGSGSAPLYSEGLQKVSLLMPDLTYVLSGCSFSYNPPNLTCNARVINNGNAPAGGSMVGFYLYSGEWGNEMIAHDYIPPLNPGEWADASDTDNIAIFFGTYQVAIKVDHLNDVDESDETNNYYRFSDTPVKVLPFLPDITVKHIEVIDGEGPEIKFQATVANEGGSYADAPFANIFYLSEDPSITSADYPVHDWNINQDMSAGASVHSYEITITVSNVPGGSYYLGLIADGKNELYEIDEENNAACDASVMVIIPSGGGEEKPVVILDVPMAKIPPVIDGIMDHVWYGVCSVPMEEQNTTDATAPTNWMDAYASFKMMYDSQYFYLFMQTQDDQINTSSANPWENDSFEIFFDGDNSKNDKATGFDANDVQLRFVYGQTAENTGNAPRSICKFKTTDYGYNCEARIPAQDMTFALSPDHTLGFEIQLNDNDTGGRNHLLKWWNASNDTWQDPGLFGTARTTNYIASDPVYILRAAGSPVIDGTADDLVWQNIPWFSDNTFMKTSLGGSTDPPFDIHTPDDWNDCRFNWKMMWQGSMLFFHADVFDNVIKTSNPDSYRNDCIEIFIDGNNDKGPNTDSNDHAYSYVYSGTPEADAAFTETAYGWTCEARMNMATDMGITPSVGHLMGFEVKLNDNDTSARDLMSAWWSSDDGVWTNPGLRGTVKFAGFTVDISDAVETAENPVPEAFQLFQNFPNPFNPSTTVRLAVPRSCLVNLTVFDLTGRKVAVLADGIRSPGEHAVVWNARDCPSGIYLIRMTAGDFRDTRKLILQK